jgi:hypothetical protein
MVLQLQSHRTEYVIFISRIEFDKNIHDSILITWTFAIIGTQGYILYPTVNDWNG